MAMVADLGPKGPALDLSGRDLPRPGISQSTTGAGTPGGTGIPRARGFHGRSASLRAPPPSGTPAARVWSGTGRWKIPLRERGDVSAWRPASRFPSQSPACLTLCAPESKPGNLSWGIFLFLGLGNRTSRS